MRETKTQGEEGYLYRHFTDDNYNTLKQLQKQYEAMAHKTTLIPVDSCNSKWCMTVEVIKI